MPAPAAAPPLATPLAVPAPPRPAGTGSLPDLAAFAGDAVVSPALLRRPVQTEGRRWQGYAVIAAIALVLAGLPLGGILLLREGATRSGGEDPAALVITGRVFTSSGNDVQAFRLIVPRGAWEGNEQLKRSLKAVVALDRKEAVASKMAAWLAVAAQDYGTQQPRDGELLKRAIERLEGFFGENLELGERPEPRELASRPALVLRFRGSVNNVEWTGECHMLSRHGFGYWLFIGGAPGAEVAQAIAAELRADKAMRFVLDDERKGWSPRPPKMETFAAAKAPFTLRGREGVWAQLENLKHVDASAEMYLLGKSAADRKDNLKSATVQVLTLPAAGGDKEALKAARERLEAATKEEGKGYQLEPVDQKKGEVAADGYVQKIGDKLGRVAELRLVRGEEKLKYILLGVVNTPQRVYVFQCEAHWPHHQAWRGDFLDLLGTFHLRGG
jgi:hypothetical protein